MRMGRKAEIIVQEDINDLRKSKTKQGSLKNIKKIEALIAIKSNKIKTRQEFVKVLLCI